MDELELIISVSFSFTEGNIGSKGNNLFSTAIRITLLESKVNALNPMCYYSEIIFILNLHNLCHKCCVFCLQMLVYVLRTITLNAGNHVQIKANQA